MIPHGLSVIIPCYNDGRFLPDAVGSVSDRVDMDYEVLIVDDGSSDSETLSILRELGTRRNVRVLKRSNGGQAAARNTGIAHAKFDAILPLDADNLAMAGYLSAAPRLIQSRDFDIVYGDALTFGDESGKWDLSGMDLAALAVQNQIDTCAVFSKEIWRKAGAYLEHDDLRGYEDWVFWLDCLVAGARFYYLGDVGFQYRMRQDSFMSISRSKQAGLLATYRRIFPRQIAAARHCFSEGLTGIRRFRRDRGLIHGHMCYFEFKYGSLGSAYFHWFQSHRFALRSNPYTRCILTTQLSRWCGT